MDVINNKQLCYSLGRRKTSTARLFFYEGNGVITVNKKPIEDYFYTQKEALHLISSSLIFFNKEKLFNIKVNVNGGGFSGQIGAILLGISRGLLKMFPDLKLTLRQQGYLTRDHRVKERRKPGLLKARKAYPFVKR